MCIRDRYLAVGNLRINLGAVDVGMAHHLRRAFYGNALGDQKGTEGVPCGVMGKVLLDAQHDTQPVNVVPKDVPLGQGEHGTGVVRGIVQFQNLPSGRVQGDEGLHLGLFPRLADIEPALRSFADVSGVQVIHVRVRQTGQRGEDEHAAGQLHLGIRHRRGHKAFQLAAADVAHLGRVLLLIMHVLQGVAPEHALIHRNIDKAVQPAQAVVHMPGGITQFLFQEQFERMAELLRDVGKGDVLQATGLEELLQVELRGLRLPERGSRMDLFGTQPEPFPLRFAAFEKGLGNGRHTCHGVFQQFGADCALFFQEAVISPFEIQAEFCEAVVLAGLADGSRLAVPILRTAEDAGRDEDAFAVDGHTAKDGGRAVGLDSFPIDIGQYLESATHDGSF